MKLLKKVFNEKVLIPYLTAGDPDLETTRDLILTLDQKGADIIEIGLPYSDPLADGPVIQEAGQRALKNGCRLEDIIKMVNEIKNEVKAPLLFMGYYNNVLQYGENKFIEDIKNAGISGVIIPDLPHDQNPEFYKKLKKEKLAGVLFVTPLTTKKRLKEISELASGFVYCVSLLGTTGDSRGPVVEIEEYMQRVRRCIKNVPLCLGFGIDGPKKCIKVKDFVDGIIIGSALIKIIHQNSNNNIDRIKDDSRKKLLNKAGEFIADIKKVI